MKYFTSESVGLGHPDKTCDFLADSFLDSALEQDPNAMMAVECAIKDDLLMIYGEATTTAEVDYENIAKKILAGIGYTNEFRIITQISEQSPDINQAVVGTKVKANDQGIVYGYATNETPEFLPLSHVVAHKLTKQYAEFIKTNDNFFADFKSQVTVTEDLKIKTVLISASHSEAISYKELYDILFHEVIAPVIENYDITYDYEVIINPSGKFTIWGSFGDSGCVGRKIVVDTYGGIGRVGGGCFSSKNATKVDRSGAYYARYVAKNVVAQGLADKCEISVSYGIGLQYPISVSVDCFGTEKVSLEKIDEFISAFDFNPQNIIDELDLNRPIYAQTALYGHFGDEAFPWEVVRCGRNQEK